MDERTLRSLVGAIFGARHPDFDDAMQEARLCAWLMDQRFDVRRGGSRRGYLVQRVRWHLQNVAYRHRLQARRDTEVFQRQPWPVVEGPDARDYDREALLWRVRCAAHGATGQARELWRFARGDRGCLAGSHKRSALTQWRRLLDMPHH